MFYVPDEYDGGAIESYVMKELQKLQDVIAELNENPIRIRHVAPTKPRNGLYFADGTDWDPGSGAGVYRYSEESSSYTHLG